MGEKFEISPTLTPDQRSITNSPTSAFQRRKRPSQLVTLPSQSDSINNAYPVPTLFQDPLVSQNGILTNMSYLESEVIKAKASSEDLGSVLENDLLVSTVPVPVSGLTGRPRPPSIPPQRSQAQSLPYPLPPPTPPPRSLVISFHPDTPSNTTFNNTSTTTYGTTSTVYSPPVGDSSYPQSPRNFYNHSNHSNPNNDFTSNLNPKSGNVNVFDSPFFTNAFSSVPNLISDSGPSVEGVLTDRESVRNDVSSVSFTNVQTSHLYQSKDVVSTTQNGFCNSAIVAAPFLAINTDNFTNTNTSKKEINGYEQLSKSISMDSANENEKLCVCGDMVVRFKPDCVRLRCKCMIHTACLASYIKSQLEDSSKISADGIRCCYWHECHSYIILDDVDKFSAFITRAEIRNTRNKSQSPDVNLIKGNINATVKEDTSSTLANFGTNEVDKFARCH